MSTMTPVPPDHPLMKAWDAYQQTEAFRNTRRWAKEPRHVDGSLWAAFEQGWRAGGVPGDSPVPPLPAPG